LEQRGRNPVSSPPVQAVIEDFLTAADGALPGFIQRLDIVGALALDDYRPGASDIDCIAVIPARPDPGEVTTLRRLHARLQRRYPRPYFGGFYVTRHALRRDPTLASGAPEAHVGRLDVRTDPTALAGWALGNMDGHWRRWHARSGRWSHPADIYGSDRGHPPGACSG